MWWDPPFMLKGDYVFIYSLELLNNHSSPTHSEMRYFPPPHDPQINVITKRFEKKKKRLRNGFMSPNFFFQNIFIIDEKSHKGKIL